MLPLTVSAILVACATATISSPGKSDDAIQADMNDCHVNALSLHDPSAVKCLASHGDTITYSGGSTAAPVFSSTTSNRPTIIKMKDYPGASPEPSAPMTNQDASDPETRTTIAEMREYFRLHVSNNSLSRGGKNDYDATINDPQAENLRTKYAIAMGLAIRSNAPANDWLYDDSKFNDIRKSCRWFQMTLDQIKSEFPGLWNMNVRDRQRFQIDPDGSIFSMQEGSIGHVQNCPTDQQRAQQRAQLETEKREAAFREQKEEREREVEAEKRAAYYRTPAGQKEQCESHCSTNRMNCGMSNAWNFSFGPNAGNAFAGRLCNAEQSRCLASCSN